MFVRHKVNDTKLIKILIIRAKKIQTYEHQREL